MFGPDIVNNGIIKKYVIFFGRLFSNIYLIRDMENSSEGQQMQVPLSYGPKEKFLARSEGNPDLERQIAAQLPRMTFEIVDYQYDPSRKLSTLGKITSQSLVNPSAKNYVSNPAPWNFTFKLEIMVKNASDGTSIIEQILPYFNPEFTASLDLMPDLSMTYDVPIILNSASQSDSYEGSFENRRTIIWTLFFTLKGWIFGQVVNNSAIVTRFEGNIRTPDGNICAATPLTAPVSEEIVVLPGLTANGEPTTDILKTIDRSLIKSTDNYGFIHDFQEN